MLSSTMGKIMNKNKYLCQICGKELNGIHGLVSHLRWHHPGITTHIYYDMFHKKGNEDICQTPGCSNKCNFHNLNKGYHKHCSRTCIRKDPKVNNKIIQTKMKSGIYHNNRNKSKETCLKKYGVKNVSQVNKIKEKKKKTCLKNNGYECWVGSDKHKEWMNNGGAAYCNRFIKNPSKPQLKLFRLCQKLLPYPIMNYPCKGYSIDIAIPQLNLAIEYDGSYWHQDKEYDKKRQNELEQEGWNFLRYIDKIPEEEHLFNDINKESKGKY